MAAVDSLCSRDVSLTKGLVCCRECSTLLRKDRPRTGYRADNGISASSVGRYNHDHVSSGKAYDMDTVDLDGVFSESTVDPSTAALEVNPSKLSTGLVSSMASPRAGSKHKAF